MAKIFMVNAPDSIRTELLEFLDSIKSDCRFTESSDDADIVIDFPDEKTVCSKDILHYGGRISCPDAFHAADILDISRPNFGDLANLLKIKVFGCQLGCFK